MAKKASIGIRSATTGRFVSETATKNPALATRQTFNSSIDTKSSNYESAASSNTKGKSYRTSKARKSVASKMPQRDVTYIIVKHPKEYVAKDFYMSPEKIEALALKVIGNKSILYIWLDRPNELLNQRSPREAIADGDGERVVGLLLSVAGQ